MHRPTGPCIRHSPTERRKRSSLGAARLGLASASVALLGGCFIGVTPVHKEVLRLPPVEQAIVVPTPEAAAASEAQAREARVTRVAAAAAAEQAARPPAPPAFIDNLPSSIYFDNDAYLVAPQFQGLLSQHAANLKANRRLRMQILAYTDGKGSTDYNRALAQMRAATVAKALGTMGVDRAQLDPQARAAERPQRGVAASDPRSRRVELAYLR